MSQVAKVLMYYSPLCGYCVMAKRLLASKNIDYIGINVLAEPEKKQDMLRLSHGQHTVPQIFINEEHIGGFTDMAALEQRGELDALLCVGES